MLGAVAQKHSVDMALNDFFTHTGSTGSQIGDRISAEGYKSSYYGENISAGNSTPQEAVTAWMNSDGDRTNILNPQFPEIGVGSLSGIRR